VNEEPGFQHVAGGTPAAEISGGRQRRRGQVADRDPKLTRLTGLLWLAFGGSVVAVIVTRWADPGAVSNILVGLALALLYLAMFLAEVIWVREQVKVCGTWAAVFAAWRLRPREPIGGPNLGVYLGAALVTLGLIGGGLQVLLGPGQTMRWAGGLALLGGITMAGLLSLVVSRPAGK